MRIGQLLALVVAGMFLTKARAAEETKVEPLTVEQQVAIEENTKMALQGFARLNGGEFDFSEASIEWLDGFVNRNRRDDPGAMADVIGSYLGSAMVQNFGGRWVNARDSIGVELTAGVIAYPFAKVRKQLANGPEDSILSFYQVMGAVLKEQKQKAADEKGDATP